MFNPADASSRIKEEFIDYITTSFSIADEKYNELFREKLNEHGIISKGPFIDIKDIFKSGNSLSTLCKENILSSLFENIEKEKTKYRHKLPLNRSLYLHQEQAIDIIVNKKKNAVITTGTGSGKTECFLIPVLNELLREIEAGRLEAGKLTPGVRALLIYPMNALANDQMKRLRELLMYYPKITFGVYNGDTEKTEEKARAKYLDLHELESCEKLRNPLDNELISREKMNEKPPHILCTNYAMLEHMMLRPENDKIFANSDFKFVVLDEAHIYTGATGMETALLLRRLKARIKSTSKTQFILTSATLGEEGKSEKEIVNFAENLCGEKFDEKSIVYGKRELLVFDKQINKYPVELYEQLAMANEDEYPEIFSSFNINYDSKVPFSYNFYDLCCNSILYKRIRENFNLPVDIESMAKLLKINKKQVISFIYICTLAEKNGKPLIDAKYHFFIRALEGMYTTLYGDKQLYLERKQSINYQDKQISCFERVVCKNCGELGIVGKTEKQGKLEKLILATQYDEDMRFFHIKSINENQFEEFDFEGNEEIEDEDSEKIKEKSIKEYYLCPICGAISEKDDGKPRCNCNVSPIILSEYVNSDGRCPKCQNGRYRRFYIGSEAATGVLATTLFEELPKKKIKDYGADGVEYDFDGGKQFLAFSDSRSEAAFFASYLDKAYKEFLRRRGLVQVLEKHKEELLEEPMNLLDLADELTNLFKSKKSFKDDLSDYLCEGRKLKKVSEKNAWIAILTELVYQRRRTSLVSLGKIKFEYIGNSVKIVDILSKKYNIDEKICKETLDYLALSFAYFGALQINEDIIDADDRKYIFYTDRQKAVVLQRTSSTDRYIMSWKSRNREGKIDSYYPNSRVRFIASILNSDEKKANEFLEDYFKEWLIKAENKYHLIRGSGSFYYMPIENYQIRIYGDKKAHWYKCNKCGKISVYNINNKCMENGCKGILEEINPEILFEGNHYLKLYQKNDLTTLLIKEHTAQLSREEGLKFQTQFEKNHIHALSCSTTFEMGVDVGELETVFLRNVPPTSANYAQRAGRAGRSKNSAAYSLTYAKLSSHDFTYFNEPEKIIVGKIKPPVFKIDNRKIVLRHIYAVVLSYFFKKNPEFFNNNKANYFLDNEGYELLVKLINDNSPERDGLYELLTKSIPDVSSYNWEEEFIGENGILNCVIQEYKENVNEIQSNINRFYDERNADKAKQAEKSLYKYKAKELIDFLVRNNILPKYGFPIDTVELDVNSDENQKQELQMSRDLKMAISEYAPGEKIVANNRMYTSRYIKKSFFNNKMDFHTSFVCKCDNCGTWNWQEQDPREYDKIINCSACKKQITNSRWEDAIEPRAGFIAEHESQEVPMTRPEKIYHSEDSYIGNGKQIDDFLYSVNNRNIILKSSENDSIMVTSNTKFYVCKKCGYTYGIHDIIRDASGKKDKEAINAIKKSSPYIIIKRKHKNTHDNYCNNTYFYPYVFNHIYKTDVVLMDFEKNNGDTKTMWSVLYALLNAMSNVLGIDRNDIGGSLKVYSYKEIEGAKYSLVLYDTVAGGAGHVRRLLNSDILGKVFNSAYDAMRLCKCDTSCYNCLRSYYNQRRHQDLDRHLAEKFLSSYLGEVTECFNKDKKEIQKLELFKDGFNIKTESYDYIFSLLEDDSLIVCNLKKEFINNSVIKPDFNDITFAVGNQKKYANFIWIEKKILFFTKQNRESYMLALNTDYKSFILDETFNLEIFLKELD